MRRLLKAILNRFPRLNHRVRAYWYYGSISPEVRYFRQLCDRTKYSVDVGVAYGAVAYWLRRHSAGVLLFEPNPQFMPLIRKCFKDESCVIVDRALSNAVGSTSMVIPRDRLGRSTIDPGNQENLRSHFDDYRSVQVETVALDAYVRYPIGFIKIDVEGHEYAVLQGAKSVLAAYHPNLMIEIEERHHTGSFEKVYAYLEGFGYRCMAIDRRRFVEITPESYRSVHDSQGVYLYNFVFTRNTTLLHQLLGAPAKGVEHVS